MRTKVACIKHTSIYNLVKKKTMLVQKQSCAKTKFLQRVPYVQPSFGINEIFAINVREPFFL
ncbi:hypothetical protein EON70_00500 [bacterium]|nr:MAG: hypothetical protein EON70_00500 [bacterium]